MGLTVASGWKGAGEALVGNRAGVNQSSNLAYLLNHEPLFNLSESPLLLPPSKQSSFNFLLKYFPVLLMSTLVFRLEVRKLSAENQILNI